MARRINQIELVGFTIPGLVIQRDALGLDGNAAFPLDVHRIEYLRRHFPLGEPPARLNKAIGQR